MVVKNPYSTYDQLWVPGSKQCLKTNTSQPSPVNKWFRLEKIRNKGFSEDLYSIDLPLFRKKSLPTFELGNHPKLGQIQYGHHDNYSTI